MDRSKDIKEAWKSLIHLINDEGLDRVNSYIDNLSANNRIDLADDKVKTIKKLINQHGGDLKNEVDNVYDSYIRTKIGGDIGTQRPRSVMISSHRTPSPQRRRSPKPTPEMRVTQIQKPLPATPIVATTTARRRSPPPSPEMRARQVQKQLPPTPSQLPSTQIPYHQLQTSPQVPQLNSRVTRSRRSRAGSTVAKGTRFIGTGAKSYLTDPTTKQFFTDVGTHAVGTGFQALLAQQQASQAKAAQERELAEQRRIEEAKLALQKEEQQARLEIMRQQAAQEAEERKLRLQAEYGPQLAEIKKQEAVATASSGVPSPEEILAEERLKALLALYKPEQQKMIVAYYGKLTPSDKETFQAYDLKTQKIIADRVVAEATKIIELQRAQQLASIMAQRQQAVAQAGGNYAETEIDTEALSDLDLESDDDLNNDHVYLTQGGHRKKEDQEIESDSEFLSDLEGFDDDHDNEHDFLINNQIGSGKIEEGEDDEDDEDDDVDDDDLSDLEFDSEDEEEDKAQVGGGSDIDSDSDTLSDLEDFDYLDNEHDFLINNQIGGDIDNEMETEVLSELSGLEDSPAEKKTTIITTGVKKEQKPFTVTVDQNGNSQVSTETTELSDLPMTTEVSKEQEKEIATIISEPMSEPDISKFVPASSSESDETSSLEISETPVNKTEETHDLESEPSSEEESESERQNKPPTIEYTTETETTISEEEHIPLDSSDEPPFYTPPVRLPN